MDKKQLGIVAIVIIAVLSLTVSGSDALLFPKYLEVGGNDTHTECSGNSCIVIQGPGKDECRTSVIKTYFHS